MSGEAGGTEPETTFELQLEGNGITVKRTVAEDVAREIVSLLMGGSVVSVQPSSRGSAGTRARSGGGTVSIREFLDGAGAKKNPQIVTAIGEYLKDHARQERFTRTDVKSKFAQAGEPAPANIHRDFGLAVSSGWIAEDQKGQFYVTDAGRKAIGAAFAGQKIRRPRRRQAKKATGNPNVDS